MAGSLPPDIAAPARRALELAGITGLADLAGWSEADLRALHGVGPATLAALRPLLASTVPAVDAYLAALPSPQRETLGALRDAIRSIVPDAAEAIKYGMPAFTLGGKGIAGYAAFKDHCSYFPMSGTVLARAGDAIAGYRTSKGGLQFRSDRGLPVGLVRRLLKLRIEEIGAVAKGAGRG